MIGMLKLFRRMFAKPSPVRSPSRAIIRGDWLGKAASAKHRAKAAVKAKKYDEAWKFYHKQKSYYLKHSRESAFSVNQTLALDASVHEGLANVLRLEGRHNEAMEHIVYWCIACNRRRIKRQYQKFQSYFRRCKFEGVDYDVALKTIDKKFSNPDFSQARTIVSDWSLSR